MILMYISSACCNIRDATLLFYRILIWDTDAHFLIGGKRGMIPDIPVGVLWFELRWFL